MFSTLGSPLYVLHFRFYNEGYMTSIYKSDGG